MDKNELKENIQKLETRKRKLISQIRKLNERKRYKAYEQKALEPFVEKTKTTKIGFLRKQMKTLDFRISTQAHTPKKERELIKELKKLESDYAKVREIERARRKLKLVTADIVSIDSDILSIEKELKEIRNELNGLYKQHKLSKTAKNKGMTFGKPAEEFSLMDLAEIEE